MLKVTVSKRTDIPEFATLYSASFPANEKIPLGNLRRTFGRGGNLFLFHEENRFVGFCYAFEYGGNIFLVYLATEPELRGMGYGSEILDYMATYKKRKSMFLVVEKECGTPEECRLRRRRKDFYKRNGWKDTGCELLSDGVYFDSMYLDTPIPENDMIATIRYYEEIHTGER